MRKFFVLLFICSIFYTSVNATEILPNWLYGTWKGTGYQPNIDDTWVCVISVNPQNNEITVDYPGINCSGKWQIVSNNGNKIILKEILTVGLELCIDNSTIAIVRIDDTHILISYDSETITGQDASAVLVKEMPGWMKGNWKGEAYQTGEGNWTIEMNLTDADIHISYPSLSCSGKWTIVKIEENRVEMLEKISIGTENCMSLVKVIVTYVDETHLAVTYYNPGSNDDIAYGLLKK